MKLELIPFEIAQIIKSKGFDWKCHSVMFDEISNYTQKCDSKHNHNKFDDRVSIPEIDLVIKWLREVHNIYLITEPMYGGDKVNYRRIGYYSHTPFIHGTVNGISISINKIDSYEQAQIAGIEGALKLI